MNHFELMGMNQQYALDLSLLQKQYFLMQTKYHPDQLILNVSKKELLDISMQLNDAYRILKDDYLRAEYLLKLGGIIFDDRLLKDKVSVQELEVIMTQLEEIEELKDKALLIEMEKLKLDEKKSMILMLTKYFAENKLEQALDITVRLKYLTNLVGNIKSKIKNADS